MAVNDKVTARERRHRRIRKRLAGTAEKPRLSVFRSLDNIYAQLIDDTKGVTLAAASSLEADIKAGLRHRGNVAAARKVGAAIARKALEKQIKTVVFDRGGYQYHGCIKALADAAREQGLTF